MTDNENASDQTQGAAGAPGAARGRLRGKAARLRSAVSGRIAPTLAKEARARGADLRDWANKTRQFVNQDILPAAASRLREADEEFQIRARALAVAKNPVVQRFVPAARWLADYKRGDLTGDMTAGVIVAIMLIPQGMAYALLAGLPPQIGLYASILPLFLYAIFGTSRALAVGPVAIVSLMVASTLAPLVEPGSAEYVAYAAILAMLSGVFLLALGIFRIGFLVNFMSHPVIAGFTSAAALIIGFSQFKHLLGIGIDRTHLVHAILGQAIGKFDQINVMTLVIGAGAICMLLARGRITSLMEDRGWISPFLAGLLPRAMPLVIVILGTGVTWLFGLSGSAGVKIVGGIPIGLPPIALPSYDKQIWNELLPAAILISIVGFLESVSVAKSLASKRRQKIVANQELVGLGAANIGAALSGAYPVTGGFSRSVVNYNAGANTPLASMITGLLIAVALLLFTPLLYHLPKAVLAAIIIVAVATLVDFKPLRHAWTYNKPDAFSYLGTFIAVLVFGVEIGILAGISVSLGLHLWLTSQPHVAIVGRVGESEHFRNVKRHDVKTYKRLLLMRVDESLYFANTAYLEDQVLRYVSDYPEIRHLVLICSAVNAIDASALEILEQLIERLADSRVRVHLAEVKGPVMDKLEKGPFLDRLAPGQVFLSTHDAVETLKYVKFEAPRA